MAQANYIPPERAALSGNLAGAEHDSSASQVNSADAQINGADAQANGGSHANTGNQAQPEHRGISAQKSGPQGRADSESRSSDRSLTSVFIIEPEALLRQMLKAAIEQRGSYRVVGTAADFSEVEKVLEQSPEILLTEMFISGKPLSGLLDQIRPLISKTKVLVVSRASDQAFSRQMQQVPAHAFVSKQDNPERLFEVLDHLRTNSIVSADGTVPKTGFEANYNDPIACLSPREREIFQLLADGFQNTVIAKKLFISPRTVETHRARVVRKLGLTSNGDLIRFAIKHGLSTL